MQAVDAAVLAAIRGSHDAFSRLSVLDAGGGVVRAWEGSSALVLDGSVTRDRSRMVRGFGSATLMNADGLLSPQQATDLFAPGASVRFERGPVVGSARIPITLATLRVTRFDAGMNGRLVISGEDPLTLLQQPIGDQVTVDGALTAEDALRLMWEPVLGPSDAWLLTAEGRTVGVTRVFTEEEDRLGAVVQLMTDLGLEVFADRDGNPVLRPSPDPTTQSTVRTFTRAQGEASTLSLTRSGDRLPFNRSVVIAEHPSGAIFRSVFDVTDTSSPIHASRIGLRVGPIYRSTQIPDQAACNDVAAARLVAFSLFQDSIDNDEIPDETLDEGDVVEYIEPTAGANDRYRLEAASIPLTSGSMSLRATRVVPLFASGL